MATAWIFNARVDTPHERQGKVTFLITVSTNLATYELLAGGDAEAEGDTTAELTVAAERELTLRRSYSQFVALRAALVKAKVPGAAALPALPSKPMFGGAVSEKETEKRCAAFDQLFKAIGKSFDLANSDIVRGFLSEVAMPIWEDVHKQAESKMRSIIHTTTGWEVQYAKNGIEIAILKVSDSDFVMIRSDLVLPLPSATVHRLYIDGANWKLWAPDTSYSEVEKVSESPENPSSVLHVHYAMPVLSDRDVVIYESTQKGLPDDPTAADSWTSFAMSIQHPHCPKRRGVVRATLMITVTLFSPTADGGARVLSYQHADPRGSIPAGVVNMVVTRGKEQLKVMRQHMIKLAGK